MTKKEPMRVFTYITNIFIVLTVMYLAIFTPYKYLLQTKMTSFYTICGGYSAIMLLLSLEGMAVGMINRVNYSRDSDQRPSYSGE